MTKELAESIKELMRSYPQGVTLVTGRADGKPFGVTVSAFSSISLDPPLVMISIAKGTRAHGLLTKSSAFAINVLSSDQVAVSERFAGRSKSRSDGFEDLPFTEGSNGSPLLRTGIGHIECKRWELHDAGDHTLVVGQVTRVQVAHKAPPLVYFDRHYTTVSTPGPSSPSVDSMLAEW